MLTLDRPPLAPVVSPSAPARRRDRRAGSAVLPPRSASAREAIASPCSKSSMRPGGRASVFRQDGFTFDAGPTIVTAPFLFEELWALCGRRLADDIELRAHDAILPNPLPRRRASSTASGDDAAMRAEVARLRSGRCRWLRALHAAERRDLPHRLRATRRRALQFHPGRHGAHRAGSRRGSRAIGACYGLVSKYLRDERLRVALQLPSAADRRQSVPRHARSTA